MVDTHTREINLVGLDRNTITVGVNAASGSRPPVMSAGNGDERIAGNSKIGSEPNGIIDREPLFMVVDLKSSGAGMRRVGTVGKPEVGSCIAGGRVPRGYKAGDLTFSTGTLGKELVYVGTASMDTSDMGGVVGRHTAIVGGRRVEANQSKNVFHFGDYRAVRAPRTKGEVQETIDATAMRMIQKQRNRPGMYTEKVDIEQDFFLAMDGKIRLAVEAYNDAENKETWLANASVEDRMMAAFVYFIANVAASNNNETNRLTAATQIQALIDSIKGGNAEAGAVAYNALLMETSVAAWINKKRSSITGKCLESAKPGSVKLITS